ncbi:DHS-like NAD/FAD-binding domain-containing protein [Laetiporus sulphureus 93-53]|uniref:DHS-like NAD/FAD-binding domain-containing protein n=1 Tax=Laetiporus sulphureus 93-53 TaxID=1314785 RepID=A0A165I7U7_9APHY|nr:DHS-like NAD/FAD-binding domain-containing protein [Laetiporus sulphureus 93-53]KZT12699.1 DHS-like NAD/FAD-binding domain-containing protein [Laetiporus sulphureus 93-53]
MSHENSITDIQPFLLEEAQQFRLAFKAAEHIIVVAGAGLSAASATPDAFAANPSLVWQFYHYRRTKALMAQPNAAHRTLAKLSIPLYLKKVAPNAKSSHLITQNVDGLSTAALQSLSDTTMPKTSILEMHGRLFDVQWDRSASLCAALATADESIQNYQEAGTKEITISLSMLPRCAKCGALARPGVVWFGEKPHHLDEINSLVFKADMVLVIGTSSTVRPASTFAYRVRRRGGKVAIFNLEPSGEDERADFVFTGGCEMVLPALFPELT